MKTTVTNYHSARLSNDYSPGMKFTLSVPEFDVKKDNRKIYGVSYKDLRLHDAQLLFPQTDLQGKKESSVQEQATRWL